MGLHNLVELTDVECPRCGARHARLETEARLGWLRLDRYALGDTVVWAERSAQGIRRPEGGHGEFEAYAECPACNKDFWLCLTVRSDVLVRFEVDVAREGYIA